MAHDSPGLVLLLLSLLQVRLVTLRVDFPKPEVRGGGGDAVVALAGLQLTNVLLLQIRPLVENLLAWIAFAKLRFRVALLLDRIGTEFLLLVPVLRGLGLARVQSYHLGAAGTRVGALLATQIIQTLTHRYVVV